MNNNNPQQLSCHSSNIGIDYAHTLIGEAAHIHMQIDIAMHGMSISLAWLTPLLPFLPFQNSPHCMTQSQPQIGS